MRKNEAKIRESTEFFILLDLPILYVVPRSQVLKQSLTCTDSFMDISELGAIIVAAGSRRQRGLISS